MVSVNWRDILRGSIMTSIVVGVILTLINQYHIIFAGEATLRHMARWGLNFLVPFTVAFYSRLASARKGLKKENEVRLQNEKLLAEINEKKDKLEEYVDSIEESKEREEKRNWAAQGLAEFSKIIRENENSEELFQNIIAELVKFMKANQGGLYLVNEDENQNRHLELEALYAFSRRKFKEKRIEPGQGLVGQCYFEKQPIYLTEVPDDYIEITSGLGDAPPSSIYIQPLSHNEQIEGIVEIASFKKFEEHEKEFLADLAQSLAGFISNFRVNDRTKKLLEESRTQEQVLREQEEEMRQNLEELEATQEDMKRKEQESKDLLDKLKLAMVEQNLREIKLSVNHMLEDAKREINFLSQVPPVAGMMRALDNEGFDEQGNSSYDDWLKRFHVIVSNLMESKELYNHISFIDMDGSPQLSLEFEKGKTTELDNDLVLSNFMESFQRLIADQHQETLIEEALVDQNGRLRFVLTKPIIYGGDIRGAIYMTLFTEHILDLVSSKEDGDNKYQIADSQNRKLLGRRLVGYSPSDKGEKVEINDNYGLNIIHLTNQTTEELVEA